MLNFCFIWLIIHLFIELKRIVKECQEFYCLELTSDQNNEEGGNEISTRLIDSIVNTCVRICLFQRSQFLYSILISEILLIIF